MEHESNLKRLIVFTLVLLLFLAILPVSSLISTEAVAVYYMVTTRTIESFVAGGSSTIEGDVIAYAGYKAAKSAIIATKAAATAGRELGN